MAKRLAYLSRIEIRNGTTKRFKKILFSVKNWDYDTQNFIWIIKLKKYFVTMKKYDVKHIEFNIERELLTPLKQCR